MSKLFVLYDGRAKSGDTDEAAIYITAASEEEAREDGKDSSWTDGIWYEYDVEKDTDPESVFDGQVTNERPRYDLPPYTQETD